MRAVDGHSVCLPIHVQVRRQGEVVQKLAHMIGTSVKLYDMVLQFLRTLFLRTRNIHYCTLRAELLMALHDLEVQVIETYFVFCLTSCLKVLFAVRIY